MAPRRDYNGVFHRSHKQNTNTAASARTEKQVRLAQNKRIIEDDGDVMMGGYRIPTVISSKGAIQHKLDRYVPGEACRGKGHKRAGGRWDEFSYRRDKDWSSAPADGEKDRYGSHQDHQILTEDNCRGYNKDSRRDRHAREYHHAVSSSRIRYEKDRYASRKQHSSTWEGSSGTHFTRHHSSSRYTSSSTREHDDSRYSSSYSRDNSSPRYFSHSTRECSSSQRFSYFERRDDLQYSNRHDRSRHQGSADNNKSSSAHSQDYARRHYDEQRVQANNRRLNISDRQLHGHGSDINPEGTFEGAMKSLASHAAKFLKNAHWRDRELIQTAVWKAYGDSIASLGNRNSRWREGHRPKEWISARGIRSEKGDDALFGVMHSARDILESNTGYVDGRHRRSAASAVLRRRMALENYRKANYDYEKTLDDLFGSGRSSRSRVRTSSISGSGSGDRACSYGGSDTDSYTSLGNFPEDSGIGSRRGRSESSEISIRGRSRSPSAGSDSTTTITAFRMRQEVPRPRPARDYPPTTYTPDPNDPTRFLNVPRPLLREQWHIPADRYNGAAWANHRRFELETGAIPAFYPDKWLSGQTFGSATKDFEGKVRAARHANNPQEPLGRECYLVDPTPASSSGFARSQSATSDLGRDFGAISLDSAPTSECEGNRMESELPDDFDLYSPVMPPQRYEMANRNDTEMPLEQLQTPDEALGQQATQLNRRNHGVDDGSRSLGEISSNLHWLYPSRASSVVSDKPISCNLSDADSCAGKDNSDLWHNSRQATPTLCLANIINYDPYTSTNLPLRDEGSQDNLIDLPSPIPPSPNITRSWDASQGHYPIFHKSPIHKPESTSEQFTQNKLLGNVITDDDWEKSFAVVHGNCRPPTGGEGSRNNRMSITNSIPGEKIPHNSIRKSAPEDFLGPDVRSDTETDDDIDFMGVDWFLK